MNVFPGVHHVAITVTDVAASARWSKRLFGVPPVLDEDEEAGGFHHTAFLLPRSPGRAPRPSLHRGLGSLQRVSSGARSSCLRLCRPPRARGVGGEAR